MKNEQLVFCALLTSEIKHGRKTLLENKSPGFFMNSDVVWDDVEKYVY